MQWTDALSDEDETRGVYLLRLFDQQKMNDALCFDAREELDLIYD